MCDKRAMSDKVVRICAWCEGPSRDRSAAVKITHTICDKHLAEELNEVKKWKTQRLQQREAPKQ